MIYKSFQKLPRLIQILLLAIPFVNWITEMAVRWSLFLHKKNGMNLLIAILVTFFGVFWVWGLVDMVWCLLYKRLTFAD